MMPRSLSPIRSVVLALLCACVVPPAPAPMPITFPPTPPGYTRVEGASFQGDERGVEFDLDSVVGRHGKEVWFGRVPPYDTTLYHSATLLDSLVLPAYGQDEIVILSECSLRGADDVEIMALGKRPRTDRVTEIRRAWRADQRRGRIVPIPTRGITCWVAQPTFCGGADLSGTDTAAIAGRCATAFVERNWYTQRRGVWMDELARDSSDGATPFDTVVATRHGTLEPVPARVECHRRGCNVAFLQAHGDHCRGRVVTMDRDFAGLKISRVTWLPAPGGGCVPRLPPAPVPKGLAADSAAVLVLPDRAAFFFPITRDTAWEWREESGPIQWYGWSAAVQGRDTLWFPDAKAFRPTPSHSFRSLEELLGTTYPDLLRPSGGHFLWELPEGRVSVHLVEGRVALVLDDSATVARVFQAYPDSVEMTSTDPWGRSWSRRVRPTYVMRATPDGWER